MLFIEQILYLVEYFCYLLYLVFVCYFHYILKLRKFQKWFALLNYFYIYSIDLLVVYTSTSRNLFIYIYLHDMSL